MNAKRQGLKADVVLEGAGVKGIGLVGALVALTDAGYQLNRISGTSAGAIVGSLAAAGLTGDRLKKDALSLDYTKFTDSTALDRIPLAGKGWPCSKALASIRATMPTNGFAVSWQH